MNEPSHEITLTDEESGAIEKALRSYLRELRGEIADTDNPVYKRELREERATLESAIAKLGGPSSGAAPPDAGDAATAASRVVVMRVFGLGWST